VIEAWELLKLRRPELICDGELQLDTALVPSVAASKANILIFPNLESANIGYKLVQRLGNAKAVGPVLMGLQRPCNDLSRGCSTEDIEGVMVFTALQASQS
ncbi:unnamed protein product, partial [Polarella glacialis]